MTRDMRFPRHTIFILLTTLFSLFLNLSYGYRESDRRESEDTLAVSDAVRFLSKYVAIPSVSGQENEAAYWLAQQCADKGLHIEYITNSPGSVNFTASLYPLSSQKPNIVFLNHMDVVFAGDHKLWKYPPFDGVMADERVWGRGSFDNKGLAVIQIFAVEQFVDLAAKEELPFNLTVLCVSGEETGGITGSALVAKDFVERFNPMVVIGEGGSGMEDLSFLDGAGPLFGISIAEKGCMLVKLSWTSDNAGHASIAGNYASLMMINGLHKLLNAPHPIILTREAELMFSSVGKKLGGIKGKVMSKPSSKLFMSFLKQHALKNPELNEILTNKITLSALETSKTSYNQISNVESAILDCRLLPGETPEDIINFIKNTLLDSLVQISVVEQGPVPLTTEPEYFFNLLSYAIESEFEGASVVPMLLPASTDNSYFRALGVPVYGLNPMIVSPDQLKAIHSYDEFIKFVDVDRGIDVFVSFLKSALPVFDERH